MQEGSRLKNATMSVYECAAEHQKVMKDVDGRMSLCCLGMLMYRRASDILGPAH